MEGCRRFFRPAHTCSKQERVQSGDFAEENLGIEGKGLENLISLGSPGTTEMV